MFVGSCNTWEATRFVLPSFRFLAPLNQTMISFSVSLAELLNSAFFNAASVRSSLKYETLRIYHMKRVTAKILCRVQLETRFWYIIDLSFYNCKKQGQAINTEIRLTDLEILPISFKFYTIFY